MEWWNFTFRDALVFFFFFLFLCTRLRVYVGQWLYEAWRLADASCEFTNVSSNTLLYLKLLNFTIIYPSHQTLHLQPGFQLERESWSRSGVQCRTRYSFLCLWRHDIYARAHNYYSCHWAFIKLKYAFKCTPWLR